MKAYEIYSCNIDGGTIWSGSVIAKDYESVSDALKRKFGGKYLYTERCGKEIKAKEINPDKIRLEHLTVGELMIILNDR